jgi:hypothetical protein
MKSMKAEDILKEESIPEEECGVCLLHEKAEEKLLPKYCMSMV